MVSTPASPFTAARGVAILWAFVLALASTLTLHSQQAPLKNVDVIQMV
jgi:hypothetical protein